MMMESLAPRTHDQEQQRLLARLTELVGGYQLSQIVACIARLDIATHIATEAMATEELASRTGAHPPALRRLLRAAAGVGLLEELAEDRFGLTPLGSCLRRRQDGTSMREFAIGLSGPALTRTFEQLTQSVMSGEAAVETALGTSFYDYLGAHPDEAAHFAGAMSELSAGSAQQIVTNFDVGSFTRIVDVGGSYGAVLRTLLEAAPNAAGVLFDRPEVIARAKRAFAGFRLADSVEFVGGDFFDEVPAGGDLYVLREIIHNWDDRRALQILQNCHRAAASGSKLLLVEVVLPARPTPNTSLAFMLDVIALVAFGGKERTRREFGELLANAGYELRDVRSASALAHPWSLLIADRA
jgi:SAM-dependent methyltransferase